MPIERNLPQLHQHYKGDYYVLVRIAIHHSNSTQWAIYRPLKDEQTMFVRPLSQFDETVWSDKGKVHRFRMVEEEEANELLISGLRDKAEEAEKNAKTDEEVILARMTRQLVEKLAVRLDEV